MPLPCLVVPFILCLVIPNYNCNDIQTTRITPTAAVLSNGNKRIVRRTVYYVPKYQSNPSHVETNKEDDIELTKIARSVAIPDWYLNAFDNEKTPVSKIIANRTRYKSTINSNTRIIKNPSNTFKYSVGQTDSNIEATSKESAQNDRKRIYKAKWYKNASEISKTPEGATDSSDETERVAHANFTGDHESRIVNVPVATSNGHFATFGSSANLEDKENEVSVTNTSKLNPETSIAPTVDDVNSQDVPENINITELVIDPTTNILNDFVNSNQSINLTNSNDHIFFPNNEHARSAKVGINENEPIATLEELPTTDIFSEPTHRSLHIQSYDISKMNTNPALYQNKELLTPSEATLRQIFNAINNIKPEEGGLKNVEYLRALIEVVERINNENKYNVHLATQLTTYLQNILQNHRHQKHGRIVIPPAVQRLTMRVVNAASKCTIESLLKNLALTYQVPITEAHIKEIKMLIGHHLQHQKNKLSTHSNEHDHKNLPYYLRNGKIRVPWKNLKYLTEKNPDEDLTLNLNIILAMIVPNTNVQPIKSEENSLDSKSPRPSLQINSQWINPENPTDLKNILRTLKPVVGIEGNSRLRLMTIVKNLKDKDLSKLLLDTKNDQDSQLSSTDKLDRVEENEESKPLTWFIPNDRDSLSSDIDKKYSSWYEPLKNPQLPSNFESTTDDPLYGDNKHSYSGWIDPYDIFYRMQLKDLQNLNNIPLPDSTNPSSFYYNDGKKNPWGDPTKKPNYPPHYKNPWAGFPNNLRPFDDPQNNNQNPWLGPTNSDPSSFYNNDGTQYPWGDPSENPTGLLPHSLPWTGSWKDFRPSDVSPNIKPNPWADPSENPNYPWAGTANDLESFEDLQNINQNPLLDPTTGYTPLLPNPKREEFPWGEPTENPNNPWAATANNLRPFDDPQSINQNPWLDPTNSYPSPFYNNHEKEFPWDDTSESPNVFLEQSLPWTGPLKDFTPSHEPQNINASPGDDSSESPYYPLQHNNPWYGPQIINPNPWLDPTKSDLSSFYNNYAKELPWGDPSENDDTSENPNALVSQSLPWTGAWKDLRPSDELENINQNPWLNPTNSDPLSFYNNDGKEYPWDGPTESPNDPLQHNKPWTSPLKHFKPSDDPEDKNQNSWLNPTQRNPSSYDNLKGKEFLWDNPSENPNDPLQHSLPWTGPSKHFYPSDEPENINQNPWLDPTQSYPSSFDNLRKKDLLLDESSEELNDPLQDSIPWADPSKHVRPSDDPQNINPHPLLEPTHSDPSSFYNNDAKEFPWDGTSETANDLLHYSIPWTDPSTYFRPSDEPEIINQNPWLDPENSDPSAFYNNGENGYPWDGPTESPNDPLQHNKPWTSPLKHFKPSDEPENISQNPWLDPTTSYPSSYYDNVKGKEFLWDDPSENPNDPLQEYVPWIGPSKHLRPSHDLQNINANPWLSPTQSNPSSYDNFRGKQYPWHESSENPKDPLQHSLPWTGPSKHFYPSDEHENINQNPWLDPTQSYPSSFDNLRKKDLLLDESSEELNDPLQDSIPWADPAKHFRPSDDPQNVNANPLLEPTHSDSSSFYNNDEKALPSDDTSEIPNDLLHYSTPWTGPSKHFRPSDEPAIINQNPRLDPINSDPSSFYNNYGNGYPWDRPSENSNDPSKHSLPWTSPSKHFTTSDNPQNFIANPWLDPTTSYPSSYDNLKGKEFLWNDPSENPNVPLQEYVPWIGPSKHLRPSDILQNINANPWLDNTQSYPSSFDTIRDKDLLLDESSEELNDPLQDSIPWADPSKHVRPSDDPQNVNPHPLLEPTHSDPSSFYNNDRKEFPWDGTSETANDLLHYSTPWTDPSTYFRPSDEPEIINQNPWLDPENSDPSAFYNNGENGYPWDGPTESPNDPLQHNKPWTSPLKHFKPSDEPENISQNPWLDPTTSYPSSYDNVKGKEFLWDDPSENPNDPLQEYVPWIGPSKHLRPSHDLQNINANPWLSPTQSNPSSYDNFRGKQYPWHESSENPKDPLQHSLPWTGPSKHFYPSDEPENINQNPWLDPTQSYPSSFDNLRKKDLLLDESSEELNDPLQDSIPWADPAKHFRPSDDPQNVNANPLLEPTHSDSSSFYNNDEKEFPSDDTSEIPNDLLHYSTPWTGPSKHFRPSDEPEIINQNPRLDPTNSDPSPFYNNDGNGYPWDRPSENSNDPSKHSLPWTSPSKHFTTSDNPQNFIANPWLDPTTSYPSSYDNLKRKEFLWNDPSENPNVPFQEYVPWIGPSKHLRPTDDLQNINANPWLNPSQSFPLLYDNLKGKEFLWDDPSENPNDPLQEYVPWIAPSKHLIPSNDLQNIKINPWLEPTQSYPSSFDVLREKDLLLDESPENLNDPIQDSIPWTGPLKHLRPSDDPQNVNANPLLGPTHSDPSSLYNNDEKEFSSDDDSSEIANDPLQQSIPWTGPPKHLRPSGEPEKINQKQNPWFDPTNRDPSPFDNFRGKPYPWYGPSENPNDPLQHSLPWTGPSKHFRPSGESEIINQNPWLDPTNIDPSSFYNNYGKGYPWDGPSENPNYPFKNSFPFTTSDNPQNLIANPWLDPTTSYPSSIFNTNGQKYPWDIPSENSNDPLQENVPWTKPPRKLKPSDEPQIINEHPWLDSTENYPSSFLNTNGDEWPWNSPSKNPNDPAQNNYPWAGPLKNLRPSDNPQIINEQPWLEEQSKNPYDPLINIPGIETTKNSLPIDNLQNTEKYSWLDTTNIHHSYNINIPNDKHKRLPLIKSTKKPNPSVDPKENKKHNIFSLLIDFVKKFNKKNKENNSFTTEANTDVTVPDSDTGDSILPIDHPNYLIPSTYSSEKDQTLPNYLVPIGSTPAYGNGELTHSIFLTPTTPTMYDKGPIISTQANDDAVGIPDLTPVMSTPSSEKEQSILHDLMSDAMRAKRIQPIASDSLIQEISPILDEPSMGHYLAPTPSTTYQNELTPVNSFPVYKKKPVMNEHNVFDSTSDSLNNNKYSSTDNNPSEKDYDDYDANNDKQSLITNPIDDSNAESKMAIEELNEKWLFEIKNDEDSSILRYVEKYLHYYRINLRTIEFIKNRVIDLFLKNRKSCLGDTMKAIQKFLEFQLMYFSKN